MVVFDFLFKKKILAVPCVRGALCPRTIPLTEASTALRVRHWNRFNPSFVHSQAGVNKTTKAEAANLTFAEFNSTGPGAKSSRPFPAQMFSTETAATWTVARVLKGWDPLTPSEQPYCWDVPPLCGSGEARLPLKTDDDNYCVAVISAENQY